MRLNTAIEVRPTQGYGLNLDAAMKPALAANPKTPIWILDELAGDEDGLVRYLLAGNPAAPVAVLARLSRDTCPTWRPTPAPRSMRWRVCSRTGTRRCGGWLGSIWSTQTGSRFGGGKKMNY